MNGVFILACSHVSSLAVPDVEVGSCYAGEWRIDIVELAQNAFFADLERCQGSYRVMALPAV